MHHLPQSGSVGGIRAHGQATGPRVKLLIAIYHTRLLTPKDENFNTTWQEEVSIYSLG